MSGTKSNTVNTTEAQEEVLSVKNLSVQYSTEHGELDAVDSVSFELRRGESYGIVGESGAGKSTIARALLRLVQSPGQITGGEIQFNGDDILELSEDEMQNVRGNGIAMIFQDPSTALNPVLTVRKQLGRVIQANTTDKLAKSEVRERIIDTMESVNISDARDRLDAYPVEFSGGMNQRIMIAMALLCDPDILIADEPMSNLDQTTGARILDLIEDIKQDRDLSVMYITHNIGIVAQHCDRMAIMYAGKCVEEGPVRKVFNNTLHPYTRDLIDCVPRPDDAQNSLSSIEGVMPTPVDLGDVCYYANRCSMADEQCWNNQPELISQEDNEEHRAACHYSEEV